jgi:endogenous inhibitor of DNA gyrase (YacG/DUF329 family)
MADLGRWLSGGYRLPGPSVPRETDRDPTDDDDENRDG